MIFIAIAGIYALITYLLSFIRFRWVKYTPSIVTILFSVYYWWRSRYGINEGMEDLALFAGAMMLFIGALGGFITAGLIDIVKNKRRK